jgi:hypothetical protein
MGTRQHQPKRRVRGGSRFVAAAAKGPTVTVTAPRRGSWEKAREAPSAWAVDEHRKVPSSAELSALERLIRRAASGAMRC